MLMPTIEIKRKSIHSDSSNLDDQIPSLEDWEIALVKEFLDHHNRIQPFWQQRISFPSCFVYAHLLKRLYRDTRFRTPYIHIQDRFQFPFANYLENGDWRAFKAKLVFDPVDLLKLVEKLIKCAYLNPATITLR